MWGRGKQCAEGARRTCQYNSGMDGQGMPAYGGGDDSPLAPEKIKGGNRRGDDACQYDPKTANQYFINSPRISHTMMVTATRLTLLVLP